MAEIKVNYNHKDDNQFNQTQSLAMFHTNYETHIATDSTLVQLETWLSNYRDILEAKIKQKSDRNVKDCKERGVIPPTERRLIHVKRDCM